MRWAREQCSRTIAVGDESGQLTLWNAASRTPIATISEGSPVEQVAFSGDGQLAVSLNDGDVQVLARTVWHPNPEQSIHTLCAEVANDLTGAQWRRYVPEQRYRRTCGA